MSFRTCHVDGSDKESRTEGRCWPSVPNASPVFCPRVLLCMYIHISTTYLNAKSRTYIAWCFPLVRFLSWGVLRFAPGGAIIAFIACRGCFVRFWCFADVDASRLQQPHLLNRGRYHKQGEAHQIPQPTKRIASTMRGCCFTSDTSVHTSHRSLPLIQARKTTSGGSDSLL